MKWISVKDKLPEYEEEVLFVNGKNQVSVGKRFSYEKGTDEWGTDNSIYFNDSLELEWATCKFWMSLPKPPKDADD